MRLFRTPQLLWTTSILIMPIKTHPKDCGHFPLSMRSFCWFWLEEPVMYPAMYLDYHQFRGYRELLRSIQEAGQSWARFRPGFLRVTRLHLLRKVMWDWEYLVRCRKQGCPGFYTNRTQFCCTLRRDLWPTKKRKNSKFCPNLETNSGGTAHHQCLRMVSRPRKSEIWPPLYSHWDFATIGLGS